MKRILLFGLAATIATDLGAQAAQPSAQQKAILAIADTALAMINRGEWAALSDLMTPEAQMVAVTAGDTVRYRIRTRDQVRTQGSRSKITERGFEGAAYVSGPVGMVWLPYDLYVDGQWSHCGVDVFTFVAIEGKWRIANLSYTIEQPPACRKHPAGPPKGD